MHLTTSFEGVNIKLKIKGNGDERLLQAKRVTARGQFSGEALGIFVPAVIWSFYDPPEGSALEEIGERWEL